ncbi:general stress protein [Neobacillus sp.]|uniref:general stress protein n=1 Tax=Neobacillus sp. TaxID=2675273 RepID=UPI002899BE2C|nr:general stress protein [Neobacillus sp.]
MKKSLEKRFSYLYTGEIFAAILFIFLSYYFNSTNPQFHLYSLFSFWFSFILLGLFLFQGAYYWHVKWKRLRTENKVKTPFKVVRKFKLFKTLNTGLLIVPILGFVVDYIKWNNLLPIRGLLISVFIYIFAILEYINYFYFQLSYDNRMDIEYLRKNKRLKKSSINKDLENLK